MSGLQLKLLASISMLIDHIGVVLFPNILVLRIIGRLAFPIYCFLLVQGFLHTKNIKKYLARIGVFALLSEVPFDLARTGKWFEIAGQNVYVTLFLGLCCMAVCSFAQKKQQPIFMVLGLLAACGLSILLRADYNWLGIAIIMVFYLLYQSKLYSSIAFAGVTGLYCAITVSWIQSISISALLPICCYNGKRGKYSLRYIFYLFYPVHLLVLYIIHLFFFK